MSDAHISFHANKILSCTLKTNKQKKARERKKILMELGLVIIFKMLKILSGCFSYRFFSFKMLQDLIVWLNHKYVDCL